MKAAVVALACVLRFASSATAAEFARPSLAPNGPVTPASPVAQPPRIDVPKADSRRQEANKPAASVNDPIKARTEAQPVRDAAKPRQDATRRENWRARVCFNATETREKITTHRLAAPFQALRVGRQQGEALRAKLCKWKQDEFVYEIFVLRRDGRIVRVFMNAQSGQAVGALDDTDRH